MVAFYRQPTGHDYSASEGTRNVNITWTVADHATTFAVLSDANFPVRYNDYDPDDPTSGRRCSSIRVNATGFKVFSITATFSLPDEGRDEHPPDEPSTSNPVVFSWGTVTESVSIDRDLNNNPIFTGAWRSPSSPPTKAKNCKQLVVTKWMDGYDNARAMAYENRVNSDSFGGAEANEILCQSIQPSGSYVVTALLVPIDHSFLFKDKVIWGDHPHQLLIKSQDSYGLVGSDEHEFCDIDGNMRSDVPLNGVGKPIDLNMRYIDTNTDKAIATSVTWAARTVPDGATVVQVGDIFFLRYTIFPSKAFGGLGL